MVATGGSPCKTGLRNGAPAVLCCLLFDVLLWVVERQVVAQVSGFPGRAALIRSPERARRGCAGPGGRAAERHRDGRAGWLQRGIALLVLFLLLATPARAALLELMVDAPGEDAAVAAGLDEALVRIAGFRSPALSDLAEAMLADADRDWLRSRERRGAGRFLLAFDRARLRSALQQAQVPVWAGSRPALLAWVVLEREDRRLLLGSGMDEASVLASLRDWAAGRELPLLVPLADLEDRRRIHTADIVGGVTEALVEPSRRYDPDGLLLLHLSQRDDRFRARAWLSHRGHEVQADTAAASAAAAAREAAAQAMDRLGARVARVLVADESTLVGFGGVAGVAELQRLRARLGALEAVDSVQIRQLLPDAVVLALSSGLDRRALAEVLAGEGFADADTPRDGAETDLWFRTPRGTR
ncbi:MAG: DUF2066 domain-containing protein [Thioalkalivibrio sp.]|nr:MAG: DUF2066 domain-containing protein [Thioalkalivibrio sp.]